MGVLLILPILTACGGGGDNGGVPKLVWLTFTDEQFPDLPLINEELSKLTREKLGADIEIRMLDTGAYKERLTMNMASNADFDLCFVGFLYPYHELVEMGGLLEIGGLLEEHAPELMSDMPDYVKAAITKETGIYAVPNVQIMAFGDGNYIRSDLVEKYNLDISNINGLTDLEPILETIKEQEPELVPSIRRNASSFRKDGDTHYISVNASAIYLEDKTNTIITYYEIPGALESAKQSYEWYKKGFYRSDLATEGGGGGDSYYRVGRYATIGTTFKPGVEGEMKAETGHDYTYLYNEEPVMSHTSPIETCIAVSRTTKNPELAVKFINLLNTDPEVYNLICFGIEGKHYDWVSDTHIKTIQNSGYSPNSSWKFGNQFNAYLTEGQAADSWTKTREINDISVKSPLMGISFEIDDIGPELTQIEKVQREYVDARINKGIEGPDNYWEAYKDALEKAGIEKVKAYYQRQVDEFLTR